MNELGFTKNEVQNSSEDQSLVQVEQSRAVAEVQAAYVIAKKFPRNQSECYSNIISSCKRPLLAEQAMYAYPRGSTMVTGPSIRLAECLAQSWGNIDFGIREISQGGGVSIAEAYAIDLQTNTKVSKMFHVPHFRDTKKGKIKLTDSRDIYELVANQGARRLRACILGVLPGDVVEGAVEQCKKTLESSDVPKSEQIKKMIIAFDEYGVKVEHLEKRLGHKMESTIGAEIVALKGIYKSIKDGMADRSAFFDIGLAKDNNNAEAELDKLIADKKVNPKTGEVLTNEKK
jgi:hypothetical protein